MPLLAGNIPSAPVAYSQQKHLRQEGGRVRSINGVGMRFTSLKAPKVITSVAPPDPYPQPPVYPRLPFHSTVQISYQPTMDIPWLRSHFIPAVRRTGDNKYADYLDLCYLHGFVTASSLPSDASRILAPNKCIPGTLRGKPVDDLLLRLRASKQLITTQRPLPGTVVLPVSSDFNIKFGASDLKLKIRDVIDSKWPRKMRNSPGHHSEPRTRNFSPTPFMAVLEACARTDPDSFTSEDVASAFNNLALAPHCVVRQAIFWTLPGEDPSWFYPGCGLFGDVPTPYMWHLHGFAWELFLREQFAELAAQHRTSALPWDTFPLFRNADDFLVLHPRGFSHLAPDVVAVLHASAKGSKCPLSLPKELVCSRRVRYDGYLLVAGHFPNPHGNCSTGVGFDLQRCLRIRIKIASAIKGLSFSDAESFLGLVGWAAPIYPHIRSLLEGYRLGLYNGPRDQVYHPARPVVKDLQRCLALFQKETIIPVGMLLCIGEPRRTVFTDASGARTKDGGAPYFGGYDDSLTAPFFYCTPVPEVLHISSTATGEDIENSTMYLELIALWILFYHAAVNRWYGRPNGFAIRWYTDSDAAVGAWRRQSSRRPYCNELIKLMGHFCCTRRIYIEAIHLPREENCAADALTHANVDQFSLLTGISPQRQVDPGSTPVEQVLTLRSRSPQPTFE